MNSKNKGNAFERKISNIFSERFKEYTGIESSFRRNIDSGSFFGGKNQTRVLTHNLEKASFGDIICPTNFNYNIECKFYKTGPKFSNLLKQEYKEWDDWIKQASQDSDHANKMMCVIVKYNNTDEIVILETLPQELDSPIKYKKYFIIQLKKFLSLPDSHFFNNPHK